MRMGMENGNGNGTGQGHGRGTDVVPTAAEGYASLHVHLVLTWSSLGGSATTLTASSSLPLLLEKDPRPPKGVIPNAKQHWQHHPFCFSPCLEA